LLHCRAFNSAYPAATAAAAASVAAAAVAAAWQEQMRMQELLTLVYPVCLTSAANGSR
jgi:hypothetical protein